VSLPEWVRARFSRPPEPVRAAVAAASVEVDERVLAWGELVAGGWLVATSRGLRVVPADPATATTGDVLPWHEVAGATWAAAGAGGTFTVTPLAEVEPGVQTRQPARRFVLTDAGDLPATVRRRVDETVVASQRAPLPNGAGALLVARRVPGQPGREWTVVFDDDADRADPEAREVARQKLAELVAAEQPD
jgi:hypothetical protein